MQGVSTFLELAVLKFGNFAELCIGAISVLLLTRIEFEI